MSSKSAKKIIVAFFLTGIINVAFGQRIDIYDDTLPTIRHYPDFLVELKIRSNNKIPAVYFGKTFFRDARADKVKVGVVALDATAKKYKMILPDEAASYFTRKVNNSIHVDSLLDSLYIVLNDLWFNQTLTRAGWLKGTLFSSEEMQSNCYINADLFVVQESSFKYLGKVDTVLSESGWLPDKSNKVLEKSVRALLASADNLCKAQKPEVLAYSKERVERFIADKNRYQVQVSPSLEKGIYFTFEDFLNNKPRRFDFIETEDKNMRVLKYKLPGDTTEDKAWGFCDGKNFYMHLGKYYYKMTKRDKTYEVIAPETVEFVNTFAKRSIWATVDYFILYRDALSFIENLSAPSKTYSTTLKKFYLNILNGRLR